MWVSSLVASLHFLAIGVGLGAVFMRGRYFKALCENPHDEMEIKRMFIADTFWGIAAILWLISGLLRAFAGLEKGSSWYLHNPLFHLKMAFFLFILVLEIKPMVALIKLRLDRKKGTAQTLPVATFEKFRRVNHTEAILAFLMIFVASAMARGLAGTF